MARTLCRDIFKVAFTFAGTLIGAGFASGQELLQFFITYGSFGAAGILFAGVLFAWLGYRLLDLSHRRGLSAYPALMTLLCGKRIGACFSAAISLFLFIVLVVMLAAAGNIAADLFGLSPRLGHALLAAAIVLSAYGGIRAMTKINSLTTPFLTLVIVLVSVSSLLYHDFSPDIFFTAAHASAQPAPHWLLSCVLYVSYNLMLGTTVLVPLGRSIAHPLALKIGSVLGGFLLAALSMLIVATILIHYPNILSVQIPMLSIACTQHALHKFMYTVVFIIAMFTTSTACLYGCAAKLRAALPLPYPLCLLCTVAVAACCTEIGFSALIAVAFPAFGYLSLWILLKLMFAKIS